MLDERTAQALAFSEFLDTHQVRILQVDAMNGGKLYFICPRGTIAIGLQPAPLALTGEKERKRMEGKLVEKCIDHVRKTLGDEYRELYMDGLRLCSALLTCSAPHTAWYSFMETDVQDIAEFTL